jgi:hypothetical protein
MGANLGRLASTGSSGGTCQTTPVMARVLKASGKKGVPQGGVITPAVRDAITRLAMQRPGQLIWVDSRLRAEHFRHQIVHIQNGRIRFSFSEQGAHAADDLTGPQVVGGDVGKNLADLSPVLFFKGE